MSAVPAEASTVELAGHRLEINAAGKGRDILFLSSGIWLASDMAFTSELARLGRVTAPVHPGYGKTPAPHHLTTADELSYLYLDLVDHIAGKSKDVLIVAGSLGAFIAAQMAIKSCQHIAGLVLLGPIGVKAGGRNDRDYVDLFAHAEPALVDLAFADPAPFRVELPKLSEEAVTERVRAREALARYVWQPYMHDPRLAGRLHRITAPTLILRGAEDRIAARATTDLMAARIPGARLDTIAKAGHLPHVEQPTATLSAIERFVASLPKSN
jgi:pimeloyl-ACP methyl ester carboxylesterase